MDLLTLLSVEVTHTVYGMVSFRSVATGITPISYLGMGDYVDLERSHLEV